jgi:hypothetical protein
MKATWKEAMRLLFLTGDDSLMSEPLDVVPSADEFFDAFVTYTDKNPSYWVEYADMEYSYHETKGYGWSAWGMLYIAITEYDLYERHTGKWACLETLQEAVQQTQHSCWQQEEDRRETQNDIDNYLSTL